MKKLGPLVLLLMISASLGCNDKDNDKYKKKTALPPFYHKLSPAQQDYWNGLNENVKEMIASAPSAMEQHERFRMRWKKHASRM